MFSPFAHLLVAGAQPFGRTKLVFTTKVVRNGIERDELVELLESKGRRYYVVDGHILPETSPNVTFVKTQKGAVEI